MVDMTTLLLVEITLILLLTIVVSALIIRRLRRDYRSLLDKYRALRQMVGLPPVTDIANARINGGELPDFVEAFLAGINKKALQRFKKMSGAKLPRLSPELPYSARIAALRYLYSKAEQEVHREKNVHIEHWILLEKKLADIARWIVAADPAAASAPDDQLRRLQEKIDSLVPLEAEADKLRKKLLIAEQKQVKLTSERHEGKMALARMQRILQVLQMANAYKGEGIDRNIHSALELDQADQFSASKNHRASVQQLDCIAELSEQKYALVKRLSDELPYSYQDLTSEQREKLTDAIRELEHELLKSDHHITSLQKELKAAKDSIRQTGIPELEKPISRFNQYFSGKEELLHMHPDEPKPPATPETLTIVHHNLPHDDKTPEVKSWVELGGHERTMEEIKRLRSNNQNQRSMIIDLEKELRALRKATQDTADEEEKAENHRAITRLERLVKECEYCIETLESEVDYLQAQLDKMPLEVLPEAKPPASFDELNCELDAMTHKLQYTIKQHVQANALNHLAVDAMACGDIESLSTLLIKTIKELNITAGFRLHSGLGTAEFYAGNKFTPVEKKLVESFAANAATSYFNEGILFARPNAYLLLKNPPDEESEQIQLENTISGVLSIISTHIDYLEANQNLDRQSRHVDSSVGKVISKLSQLEKHYNYQTDETCKTFDNLVEELNRSLGMTDMSPTARTIFDNAIGECGQRLTMLQGSRNEIHQTAATLAAALENLRKGKA